MTTRRPLRSPIARLALLLVLVLGLAGRAAATDAVAEIGEHLDRLEKLGFAGSLVLVVAGEPVLARGYGLADRERGVPWTLGTVSTIGSITKQFTGAAILSLEEEGRLAVGDPIGDHLPGVPEDKRGITLHHLLTHSSGIVDLDGAGDWDPIHREEFVRRSLAQELAFEPGSDYAYSNAGYSLLGAIIERLSGESYEAFLRRRLLVPAGLFETGYVLAGWDEGRVARGYRGDELWGTVLGRPLAEDGPFWVLRANGGLHSTPWDMVRWAQALMSGRVLSRESMQRYWAPHVDEGSGDSFYGYGWVVMDAGGQRLITHNGGNGIFFADMAILPEAGSLAVLMTNVVPEFPLAGGLLERIGDRLLGGVPLPAVPDIAAVEGAELETWAGSYALDGGGELAISVGEGRLHVEPLDPLAFASLLSVRPLDAARSERLSGRIETIVAAAVAGDLVPLHEAYGRVVTVEYLVESRRALMANLEERHGAFRSFRVLGTAFREGRDVTLVALDFARGTAYRAYVWDPDAEEDLLGVSRRGLDHVLRVYPVTGGGFMAWDARSGAAMEVEITEVDGSARLSVAAGTRLTAQRSATP